MIVFKEFYFVALTFLLLSIALLFILRKFRPHPLKEAEQQVIIGPLSFFFAIYAFFLSFAVITLWQNYSDVQTSVVKEANSVSVCYMLSHRIPDAGDFRQALISYTRSVINDEWKDMEKEKFSDVTDQYKDMIFRHAGRLQPQTPAEVQVFKELLDALRDFNERRLERLLSVSGTLLAPMWIILIIGAVCSIVGLYYLSLSHNRVQVTVDLILIGIIVISVLLIGEMNKPFQGSITISNKAFQIVLNKMEKAEGQKAPITAKP